MAPSDRAAISELARMFRRWAVVSSIGLDHLGKGDASCGVSEKLRCAGRRTAAVARRDHDAVQRAAEIPSLGVDSAKQIIAELGATVARFPQPSTSPP